MIYDQAIAAFFNFLCTPVGQKYADQVFKDAADLRAQFDLWLQHVKPK
jgi:hypothetical protein